LHTFLLKTAVSGDTVMSRVSNIKPLPCIFTRAGKMRALEIFGSQ